MLAYSLLFLVLISSFFVDAIEIPQDVTPDQYSRVRLVYGSPTHYQLTQRINLRLNDSLVVENVDYGMVSPYTIVWPGQVANIEIDDVAIPHPDLNLEAGHDYTAIFLDISASNLTASDSIPSTLSDSRRIAFLDDNTILSESLNNDMAAMRIVQLISDADIPLPTHSALDSARETSLALSKDMSAARTSIQPLVLPSLTCLHSHNASVKTNRPDVASHLDSCATDPSEPEANILLLSASAHCVNCSLYPLIPPLASGYYLDITINTAFPFQLAIAQAMDKPSELVSAYGNSNATAVAWAGERHLVDFSDQEHGIYTVFIIPAPVKKSEDGEQQPPLLVITTNKIGKWPYYPIFYAVLFLSILCLVYQMVWLSYRECTSTDEAESTDQLMSLPVTITSNPAPLPTRPQRSSLATHTTASFTNHHHTPTTPRQSSQGDPDSFRIPLLTDISTNDAATSADTSQQSLQTPATPTNTTGSTSDSNTTAVAASTPGARKPRLLSLDSLRGLTLCLMVFANSGGGGYEIFEHATWHGVYLMDFIFPFFMFMMGVSMCMSFKSLKDKPLSFIVKKIIIRSIKLFLLGLFLNNIGKYQTFRVWGILQRFGVTYLFVSLIAIVLPGLHAKPTQGVDDLHATDLVRRLHKSKHAKDTPDTRYIKQYSNDRFPLTSNISSTAYLNNRSINTSLNGNDTAHMSSLSALTSFDELHRQHRSRNPSPSPHMTPQVALDRPRTSFSLTPSNNASLTALPLSKRASQSNFRSLLNSQDEAVGLAVNVGSDAIEEEVGLDTSELDAIVTKARSVLSRSTSSGRNLNALGMDIPPSPHTPTFTSTILTNTSNDLNTDLPPPATAINIKQPPRPSPITTNSLLSGIAPSSSPSASKGLFYDPSEDPALNAVMAQGVSSPSAAPRVGSDVSRQNSLKSHRVEEVSSIFKTETLLEASNHTSITLPASPRKLAVMNSSSESIYHDADDDLGCLDRLLVYWHSQLTPETNRGFFGTVMQHISMKTQVVLLQLLFSFVEILREMWMFRYQWLIVGIFATAWLLLTFLLPVPGCPTGYLGAGGLLGDYSAYQHAPLTCTGGAAGYIDRITIGLAHMYQNPTVKEVYHTGAFDPEGLLGCLTSVVCVYIGLVVGRVVVFTTTHKARLSRWFWWMFITAFATVACTGFSFDLAHGPIPANKNLWTLSFVFICCSAATGMMILMYLVIDVWKVWSGKPFFFVGMNSIGIFIMHSLLAGRFPFSWVVYGTPQHSELLALSIHASAWVIIISYVLYQKKIFFKV